MKNALQNLLILFALGLCGLITYQWKREVGKVNQIKELSQQVYNQSMDIQGYTNTINRQDEKIAEQDKTIKEASETIRSNLVEIAQLRRENNRLEATISQYSNAVVALEARIDQANEAIRQQNEAMKQLVAQRDEYVERLNESVKERNEIVTKYNDLVKQVEAMQEAEAKKKKKQ